MHLQAKIKKKRAHLYVLMRGAVQSPVHLDPRVGRGMDGNERDFLPCGHREISQVECGTQTMSPEAETKKSTGRRRTELETPGINLGTTSLWDFFFFFTYGLANHRSFEYRPVQQGPMSHV